MLNYPIIVQKGDTLTSIGERFGYENPGPIYYFSLNSSLFKKRKKSGNLILSGDKLCVPWHPRQLYKMSATYKHLIENIRNFKKKELNRLNKEFNKIDNFLNMTDLLSIFALQASSITMLSTKIIKGNMVSKEILKWLVMDRLSRANDIGTFIVRKPDTPKKDFNYWFRHTSGKVSPSYWTECLGGKSNSKSCKYGRKFNHQENKKNLVQDCMKDIIKYQSYIKNYKLQADMGIYKKKI